MSGAAQAVGSELYYELHAKTFAPLYDSVAFTDVHAALLGLLPASGASILDIGSGSGRDALALARMGYQVTALEPSPLLRHHAIAQDGATLVRWLDDCLPALAILREQRDQFAFILCAGVLMHVAPSDLAQSFVAFHALLKAGGKVAVSIRKPLPEEPQTAFHNHAHPALVANGRRVGLELVTSFEADDALGRADRRWSTFVFVR